MLEYLNSEQQKAVLETEGPIMVFAGAGSGKTRTLTYRIAYMISEKNIKPENILAITFTNKATNVMRERLIELVGANTFSVTITTFHSLCARILRKEIIVLGYTRAFSIIDEEEQLKIISDILGEFNGNKKRAKEVQKAINYCKCFDSIKAEDPFCDRIWTAYEERMKTLDLLDFEDLLIKVRTIFLEYPEIKSKYQEKFQYILVDEFQDTSLIQYKIIKELSSHNHNIFVVGDDDQSIYSFRGTNYENIALFKRDFPEHKTFHLVENYRSTQVILDGCNKLIANNCDREKKELFSQDKGQASDVVIHQAENESDEVNYVINNIMSLKDSDTPWTEFAVLYRSSVILRNFEIGMIKANLPYRVYGGVSYLKRREVKDIIAYLKLIINNNDWHSFKRIINVPQRGIGDATLKKIEETKKLHKFTILEALTESHTFLNKGKADTLKEFMNMILYFSEKLEETNLNDLFDELVGKINYLAYLKDETENYDERKDNLMEFKSVLYQIEATAVDSTRKERLREAFDHTILSDEYMQNQRENKNGITLSTVHSVKGLEFKYVFVVSLEENVFPNLVRIQSSAELEEERRIAYVAFTRAKRKLFLLTSKRRMLYGSFYNNPPSRFLLEFVGSQNPFEKAPKKVFEEKAFYDIEEKDVKDENVAIEYKVGDEVFHDKFKDGVIIGINGEVAQIFFAQEKRIIHLMLSHPSLKKK